MTDAGFRTLALGFRDTVEAAHMGHPDFRANGRIFASLTADGRAGMVRLPPEEQARFVCDYPSAFAPESGAWGRQGYTRVTLAAVDADVLGDAMTLAWQAATAHARPGRRTTARARAGRRTRR